MSKLSRPSTVYLLIKFYLKIKCNTKRKKKNKVNTVLIIFVDLKKKKITFDKLTCIYFII